jgi:glycerate kinase
VALLVSLPFGPRLSARAVAAALAAGLRAGGVGEVDLCPLDAPAAGRDGWAALLAPGFETRLLAARAVVLAERRLEQRALRASLTFEVATRARQSGVPAYAVAARNGLDAFDARMLDLQIVLEARTARALTAAGATLADLI